MKSLKYLFLIAVPVVLLSCGQSNTQNRGNQNDRGMGGRDFNKVQTDKDRTGSQGIQSDTSKYRSGSGSNRTEGMGSQDTSRHQSSTSRSGSQGTSKGSTSRSGSQSNTNRSTNQNNPQVDPR